MVEATIEVIVTSGNSNLYSQFQLTDGTNISQTISCYIVTKTYDDKGIVAISFVFNYTGVTSVNKNFTLQHKKIQNGNNKNSGGTGTLTSSNVNTIGFFLNSDPNSTLSIKEDILNTNIAIYPNPAQEQFYINNNATNGETSFKFYTVTGQLVHTINVLPKTNTKLDVTGWASGIYIMKATNNGVNIAKKLIIE